MINSTKELKAKIVDVMKTEAINFIIHKIKTSLEKKATDFSIHLLTEV